MDRLDETDPNKVTKLPPLGGRLPRHMFDIDSVLAVNTALDCGRPLLVRGEPGTGKSQLARAAAVELGRVFLSRVVDARTEAHELLWEYDALARLADAQAAGTNNRLAADLDRLNYTRPGPLWWALNWTTAKRQAERCRSGEPKALDEDSSRGVVLLIDEIDKADMAVPNALLECLGHGCFRLPGLPDAIALEGPAPLVVLTTNTDRVLPDAFMRRCVVLPMRVPQGDELKKWLVERGAIHFELPQKILEEAAMLVVNERNRVASGAVCPPGLAEYIDLLTAAMHGDPDGISGRLDRIKDFVLRKNHWAHR
jgi:MoxR-like ATPase